VSYFRNHFCNLKFMRKLYYYLIDLLQLSNFLEIFDYAMELGDESKIFSIFDFVLNDQRFKSLFITSLEFQKFIFVKETLSVAEEENIDSIIQLLNQEPYIAYVQEIDEGNYGQEYTTLTIRYLQDLAR